MEEVNEKQKRVYIFAKVSRYEGQNIHVKIMLDSGNNTKTGFTINNQFLKRMRLKYVSLCKRGVGIADQKGKLLQLNMYFLVLKDVLLLQKVSSLPHHRYD